MKEELLTAHENFGKEIRQEVEEKTDGAQKALVRQLDFTRAQLQPPQPTLF